MTNYLSILKTNRFLMLFVGSIALYSCGSYQNSSYYDNDGVYGADTSKKVVYQEQTANTSKYAAQFQSMREEYTTNETFTDVNNYSTPIDTVKTKTQSYAGWGNNQSNVVVNVYNNSPYWGWGGYYNSWGWNNWYGGYYPYNNWGWGWNNWYGGYYGYNWGWGWNNWYGGYYGYYGPYNNWGWNGWYGGYGYGGNHIAYNHGRRGSVSGFANGADYSSGRQYNGGGRRSGTSVMEPPRRDTGTPRPVTIGQPRSTTIGEPRSTQPRVYSHDTNGTGTPRSTTTQPRTVEPRTTNQPRTIEPRTNSYPSTPRNSDYGGGGRSGGFGGGGGGGFGGGGRSGGGGGGRRG